MTAMNQSLYATNAVPKASASEEVFGMNQTERENFEFRGASKFAADPVIDVWSGR